MSWKLLIATVIVHLILIYSIFDVYYTSPLIHGLTPHFLSNIEPPAKRIFIISADGLRYDTFGKYPEKSPFLHSIIRDRKGISGLSLSHVPTESRPGHVAIFAGITEDVSAVARGWKKNPVAFDSVFNRSSISYMWGSPDIVNLFDDLPNTKSFFYSEEEEDFASNDASKLDRWVFENVENFLKNASEKEREEMRNRPQQIFFLHLLGIDTNGHGNKPKSSQYIDNIKVVDDGIEKLQDQVNTFFGDDKTAWLFTSDHGMTDWGSHGAGSDEEVLTPFVAWGAGIRKGGARTSINQIDLTPLISVLIGTAIPVNSMGIIPTQLLNTGNLKFDFRAILSNFLQLKEQIIWLKERKSNRFWFRQYGEFGDKSMEALEAEMIRLARARRFEAAIALFSDKCHLLKKAIVFYHRYDRQMLGAAVSATFVAWICLVFTFLNEEKAKNLQFLRPNRIFSIGMLFCGLFSIYCRLTMTQIVYFILPVYLFSILENYGKISEKIEEMVKEIRKKENSMNNLSMRYFVKPFLAMIAFSIIILAFVLTFIDRKFLALIFGLLIFLPNAYDTAIVGYWSKTWKILCITLLPFPFFPSVGVSTHIPVCIIAPSILAYFCWKIAKRPCLERLAKILEGFSAIFAFVGFFILVVNYGFEKTPWIARWLSWSTIPMSAILPSLITKSYLVDRLACYALSVYIPYSLLSISYESMFMLIFMPILAIFVRFEFGHLSDVELLQIRIGDNCGSKKSSQFVEYRRAIACVALVMGTLFGTGNFASINSFNPSTLLLFISVFSPFTMAFLLVLKILIPVLCVTMTFASIVRFEKILMQRLCCIVLIFTDFMSMCFFHQLKDEGSWLEIGMSISQYIVSMCISLALLILLSLSSSLLAFEWKKKKYEQMEEIEAIDRRRTTDEAA